MDLKHRECICVVGSPLFLAKERKTYRIRLRVDTELKVEDKLKDIMDSSRPAVVVNRDLDGTICIKFVYAHCKYIDVFMENSHGSGYTETGLV